MALTKIARRERIKMRVRKVVSGTPEMPRLTVFRSNKQIYAQLIDDKSNKTLCCSSSLDQAIAAAAAGKTKVEQAALVGQAIAQKAVEAGVTTVCFDRNGYLYHGRVKQLADAARKAGLKF
ncbi:MAG: 50S ribosomal protein L18 [Mucinivorans sp.]